eukprot:78742-Amphidinium_carterae.2
MKARTWFRSKCTKRSKRSASQGRAVDSGLAETQHGIHLEGAIAAWPCSGMPHRQFAKCHSFFSLHHLICGRTNSATAMHLMLDKQAEPINSTSDESELSSDHFATFSTVAVQP